MKDKVCPARCPLISSCIQNLSEDIFLEVCRTKLWVCCDYSTSIAQRMGWVKKPREWNKEFPDDDDGQIGEGK